MEIKDRIAVVTGGASGIGRALCFALAQAGAAGVVVADVDGQGASEVRTALTHDGHRAIDVEADLSTEAGVAALNSQALAEFGQIDLLCSNAGIIVAGGVELPDEIWSKMWAVNVQSHVALVRAVPPGHAGQGKPGCPLPGPPRPAPSRPPSMASSPPSRSPAACWRRSPTSGS